MLTTTKRNSTLTIADDQIEGSFKDLREPFIMTAGKGNWSYWVNLTSIEDPTESVMLNTSRRVTREIDNLLNGVGDGMELEARKALRLSIVHKALDECSVAKVQALNPAAEGETIGTPKFDKVTNEPIYVYKIVARGEGGLTAAQVNASVAKAPAFSLKSAMSNAV